VQHIEGKGARPQIRPLTSLRFGAAMAVMLTHLKLIGGGGAGGVQFFFVLSGFILAYQYRPWFADTVSPANATRFLWLRFGRLFPVYLVTFALGASPRIGSPWPLSPFETARAALMFQSYWPIGERVFAVNGPSWSVSDEMFFYVLFPLICCALTQVGTTARLALVAAGVLAVSYVASRSPDNGTPYTLTWWAFYISPYLRIAEFALGAAVGVSFDRLREFMPRSFAACAVVEVAVIAVLVGALAAPPPLLDVTGYAPLMALAIVFCATSRGPISIALDAAPLVYLGEISYSLYMTHGLVIECADRFLSQQFFGASAAPWHIMAQAGLILFTICLSDVLYRWVERPCRSWAKQQAARWSADTHTGREQLSDDFRMSDGQRMDVLLPSHRQHIASD
jgi:peptidoglycan/LPS O-acetylase OafA/YrhL